ncbi:ABC transporter substrate-binding protein [Halorubellus litoreus]|uniref:ABC transporter substrate-binding protein n=1 Tax=Halorubellus litoreus TaxID=755308 RepID=A0ABD5VGJ9_9EURY
MRRLRSITGWQSRSRVSLEIKTAPADSDPYALRIARQLASWYDAVGIDASVVPLAEEELYRKLLLDHDFDVFVGRLTPGIRRPDDLYALLHSQYANAPGWQNPFGYANLGVDERLVRQRQTTTTRRQRTVARLQRSIARTQPFTTLVAPDDVRAVRTSRFDGWTTGALDAPTGFLALQPAPGASSYETETLRVVVTDDRVTENLNPLAVEYRRGGFVMDLLYDSLGYATADGTVEPWLAASWDVTTNDPAPTATVTLREDLTWHDGEPLTAGDVAFTFRFLADTTLDDGSSGGTSTGTTTTTVRTDASGGTTPTATTNTDTRTLPAPRFQGRAGLVRDARVLDEQTVEMQFVNCEPHVAKHAFTVPLLPEHVWVERTGKASISGIEFGAATEALVTDNVPPVGSGAFEYASHAPRESLELERFDEYFLERDTAPNVGRHLGDGPAFDRLSVQTVGSDSTAVEMVADDEADVTGTPVGASTVPRIGRSNDLDLLVAPSDQPYVVGYNAEREPLTNPRFRNTLARLVDQSSIANDTFTRYATPVASPLAGTRWLPDDLAYDETHPVTPFLGEDGELNVRKARRVFQEAGFEFADGHMVRTD